MDVSIQDRIGFFSWWMLSRPGNKTKSSNGLTTDVIRGPLLSLFLRMFLDETNKNCRINDVAIEDGNMYTDDFFKSILYNVSISTSFFCSSVVNNSI